MIQLPRLRYWTSRLKTFTIGFEEGNNEAPFAKQIAKHIGTEHTEYYCKTKEAKDIIPTLPFIYDEPFADNSAIPTILVSKLARESVTVALLADAGDEIFGGYSNNGTFLNNLSLINRIPHSLRNYFAIISGMAAKIIPENFLNHKLKVFSILLKIDETQVPQVLLKHYYTLDANTKGNLFLSVEKYQNTIYEDDLRCFKDSLSLALATDNIMYLPNDILTKVDRATMSVSLEGREPYLDHRIIEFAARLPSSYKYGITSKMILKDIVYDYVPKQLMDRPKTGFSIPVNSWLKGDLSYLLDENLNSSKISKSGIFNPIYLQNLLIRFKKGQLYDPSVIWKLLQFQMWYYMWIK